MKNICKDIEQRVASYISRLELLRTGAPVVVALSGGADSVALLAILCALGYDCRAAHCNFHLRGEESMRDMRHAAAIAAVLDVDLYVRDFDTVAYASQQGLSVEVACRELRYAWFSELLDREGAQATAVGHHREDRAETFFLNLMRGTGIAGLTSMRPRQGSVVRPLLCLSRSEIEEYLAARGLTYVDDSSNASDAHRRNRLRNGIIPALETAFPGAMDSILRTVTNLETTERVYRDAIDSRLILYRADNTIDLQALASDPWSEALLFETLYPMGFTPTQISDMLAAAGQSGKHFMSTDGHTVAELSRGTLHLTEAAAIERDIVEDAHRVSLRHDITEPVKITVGQYGVENFRPEPLGASVAYFDASALDGDAVWELRHPRRGDRMVPFGATKSKLLSDIFASAKFSAEQKRSQWVLTRNGEILWLPGLRNSALWSVGPSSRRYIRLYCQNSK